MDHCQNFDPPAAHLVSHDIRYPGNDQFADSCDTARSAQAGVQAKAVDLGTERGRKPPRRCGIVQGDKLENFFQVSEYRLSPPQREAGFFCH